MTHGDQVSDAPLVAVIDDEEDVITYLRVALEDHGYNVAATQNPAEALELLEHSIPNLICLDLVMPVHTGISLYSALSRHPHLRKIPIVILSGLAVEDELPRILEKAGGLPEPAGFIEKPVDAEEFVATVDRILRKTSKDRS